MPGGGGDSKTTTEYKSKLISLACDEDFDIAGPQSRGALVLGDEA